MLLRAALLWCRLPSGVRGGGAGSSAHRRSVSSAEPVATVRPSGETARQHTRAVWPPRLARRAMAAVLGALHTSTVVRL